MCIDATTVTLTATNTTVGATYVNAACTDVM